MLLSLILFAPLLVGILILILPRVTARVIALFGSTTVFVVSLFLLKVFIPSSKDLQLAEKFEWIPAYGINYFIAIDGISLWLVILTTFLTPLVVLASWNSYAEKVKSFYFCVLLLETTMLGTFLAMDAILFYTFFEMALIPMYLMIGIWGGQRRLYATMKFFIYTMAGSVLMLVGIITLMVMTENQLQSMSASILDFYRLQIPFVASEFLNPQTLMFVAFSIAFAIKVPMFPVHTWLPDAHVEAPTPGSVILAAVMLKMGTYGFLRFVLPLFPEATQYWGWVFMFLGVVGVIYGALVAMVQPDMKKLVAYSSVSHMGYVVLGIFALNTYGLTGSLYQMLNHGISTGALFLLVGMIYDRTHSREIAKYGGLAPIMPIFTIIFIIVTLSSIAVPGTNGFIGEFLILFGTFAKSPVYGTFAALGVVLGAVYMLWMVKKVFFGPNGELVPAADDGGHHGHGHDHDHESNHGAKANSHSGHHAHELKDLNLREIGLLVPLLVLIFWMGIFPNHFLSYSKASLDHLANNLNSYELAVNVASPVVDLNVVAKAGGQ